jgi:hypothetical protein
MEMQTEEITIRVDSDAAQAYRAASEQERRKLNLLLSLRLPEALRAEGSLEELMRDISFSICGARPPGRPGSGHLRRNVR